MVKDASEVNEDNLSEGKKITLKEAASVSIVIITFTEKQPRYAAQEVMLLDIVHSAFMSNKCQELLKNPQTLGYVIGSVQRMHSPTSSTSRF